MKALTLTQPWATLVAIGAKRIETRSFRVSYRGPLAIHAAKGFPTAVQDSVRYDMRFFAELNPSYAAHIVRSGVKLPPTSIAFETLAKLPRGAVIATCKLVDCREIIAAVYPRMPDGEFLLLGNRIIPPPPPELYFGDYSPGRYAWMLEDIHMLSGPIPARGALGLWEWDTGTA